MLKPFFTKLSHAFLPFLPEILVVITYDGDQKELKIDNLNLIKYKSLSKLIRE
jgi:hypothetical protein